MPELNSNNPETIIEETILKLEQMHDICLNNERDRIANLIHELVEEFPFLDSLDTSSMTYADVLKLIAEHCENINYAESHTEYDEFEFVLTRQNPNPKMSDLFFILFLIFATKNKAVSFCFKLGNIKRHKPNDNQALRLISDNSVSILDTENNKLKFICSIDTAFSEYILNTQKEFKSIDNFLFCKQKHTESVADYLEKRQTGVNLNNYKELHDAISGIANGTIPSTGVYQYKNKIKLLRR